MRTSANFYFKTILLACSIAAFFFLERPAQAASICTKYFWNHSKAVLVQDLNQKYPATDFSRYIVARDIFNYDESGNKDGLRKIDEIQYDFLVQNNIFSKIAGRISGEADQVLFVSSGKLQVKAVLRVAGAIEISWADTTSLQNTEMGKFVFLEKSYLEIRDNVPKYLREILPKNLLTKRFSKEELYRSLFTESLSIGRASQALELVKSAVLKNASDLKLNGATVRSYSEFQDALKEFAVHRQLHALPLFQLARRFQEVAQNALDTALKEGVSETSREVSYTWDDLDHKLTLDPS